MTRYEIRRSFRRRVTYENIIGFYYYEQSPAEKSGCGKELFLLILKMHPRRVQEREDDTTLDSPLIQRQTRVLQYSSEVF